MRRLKLSIFIDGMSIGSDLVIFGGESAYIERFVTHNSKFKFVPISNEAVGDPTSSENGIVKIIATVEKTIYRKPVITKLNVRRKGAGGSSADTQDCGYLMGCDCYMENKGATVDGDKSSQVFEYTSWEGDSSDIFEFEFNLKGLSNQYTVKQIEEIAILKQLQEKYPNIK